MTTKEMEKNIQKYMERMETQMAHRSRVPSWVKKSVVGAGLVLMPITYASCISLGDEVYAAPTCDMGYNDQIVLTVTFEGEPVAVDDMYSQDITYEYLRYTEAAIGEYTIELCTNAQDRIEEGFTLVLHVGGKAYSVEIPPDQSFPLSLLVELTEL